MNGFPTGRPLRPLTGQPVRGAFPLWNRPDVVAAWDEVMNLDRFDIG